MEERADRKAFLIVAFQLQPSEVDNLTGYEVEALMKRGKEAGLIK